MPPSMAAAQDFGEQDGAKLRERIACWGYAISHDAEIGLCHDVMPPRIAARGIVMSIINSRKCVPALCAFLISMPVAPGQSRRLSRQQTSTEPSTDQIVTELRHMQVGGISDELMISYARSRVMRISSRPNR
jgi:hypothetical protein